MKLSTLFTVNAIAAVLFGLGFLLMPAATLSPYGITTDQEGINIARLYGAAILGYAVLSWSARNTEESAARRAIVLTLFVLFSISFVVSVANQLTGISNALGWSTPAIFLLLALGFGYFQFAAPSRTPEPGPDSADTASR